MKDTDIKKQPPVGLKPRWLHEEQRLKEVKEAILRYIDAGVAIPKEWMEEYEELIQSKHIK